MKKNYFIIFIFLGFIVSSFAQTAKNELVDSSRFDKKWLYGGSFQSLWTNFIGNDLAADYFFKPSVGGNLLAEFHLNNKFGIGGGIGFQNRGAGRITLDFDKSLGNADSTHRAHYRVRSIEFPIYAMFKSPIRNSQQVRFSAKIGAIYSWNMRTSFIFHSVEDGFHDIQNLTEDFYKSQFLFNGSLGIDINAGDAAIFQIHLLLQQGTGNIFNNPTIFGSSKAYNRAFGIQLGFFY